MNHTRYPTTEERIIPPLYIPRRLQRLLMRLAQLEEGRYLITLDVFSGDSEPHYTVLPLGKVEKPR